MNIRIYPFLLLSESKIESHALYDAILCSKSVANPNGSAIISRGKRCYLSALLRPAALLYRLYCFGGETPCTSMAPLWFGNPRPNGRYRVFLGVGLGVAACPLSTLRCSPQTLLGPRADRGEGYKLTISEGLAHRSGNKRRICLSMVISLISISSARLINSQS